MLCENAGLCKAVLPALKSQIKGTHGSMTEMLYHFIKALPPKSLAPALTVLLNGGLLELTMGHIANAGPDEIQYAVGLFGFMARHPFAQEDLAKKAMLEQLTQWVAKWLVEVRKMLPQ